MGQWFGGCSLPMAGIAALGVAPEYRGIGAAAELITSTLHELYAKGVPISTLYASTQRLYQKVGYEQAGNICQFSIPTSSLIPSAQMPILRVDPAAEEVFQDLYCQRAKETNGNLNRNRAIWKRVLQPLEDVVYAYLLGAHKPEGYIVFSQQSDTGGYNLKVTDLVVLTPAAGRCVWNFFANHRSLANNIHWVGPAVEPLLTFLPEQTYKVIHLERWFLRVVNVPKALMLRGYPLGVETELHLEVKDELLSENNQRFILAVSKGRGEVTQGGRGDLRLDVRGLAQLYTSLFTPHQLQVVGQIEATANALSIAAQLFAGSEPWMSDHF
jgi:predicted acetyltransferase